MTVALLMVRHTEVARHWKGRCYGVSDVGLSRAGAAHARALAPIFAAWRPDIVIHSDLRRTRMLALQVAAIAKVDAVADASWRERDFGDWEGKSWLAIYRSTGNAMDGMITAPDSFRPGGGETTTELADRISDAIARLTAQRIVIVTHGGPIAAAQGRSASLPERAWLALVPRYGETWERPANASSC